MILLSAPYILRIFDLCDNYYFQMRYKIIGKFLAILFSGLKKKFNMEASRRKRPNGIILNFFYKDHSPDCQVMRKVIYSILDDYFDRIRMIEIDFDQNKKICNANNVYGVPTLLVMNNNKVINRYSGILDSQEIKHLLDQLIKLSS
jgi:thioredoxin 1